MFTSSRTSNWAANLNAFVTATSTERNYGEYSSESPFNGGFCAYL